MPAAPSAVLSVSLSCNWSSLGLLAVDSLGAAASPASASARAINAASTTAAPPSASARAINAASKRTRAPIVLTPILFSCSTSDARPSDRDSTASRRTSSDGRLATLGAIGSARVRQS
eukprot:61547-Prymnesium_polylepis.1